MFNKKLIKELKDHITNKAIELEVENKKENRDFLEKLRETIEPIKVENLRLLSENKKQRKEIAKLTKLLEEDITKINKRIDNFGNAVKDMQNEKKKANVAGFKEGLEKVKAFLDEGKKEDKKVEQMTIDGKSIDIKELGLIDPHKEAAPTPAAKLTNEEVKRVNNYLNPARIYSVDDILKISGLKSRSSISRKISKICQEEHISKSDRRYWYKASNGYNIGNGKEGKEWKITELGKKKILEA